MEKADCQILSSEHHVNRKRGEEMFSGTKFFIACVCLLCIFDMQTYVRQGLQILRIRIKPNSFQLEGAAPHQIFIESPSREYLKGPQL